MIYDIAIIGGGPAGMMAAGRSAELGANVILLEKNKDLGLKLLMTGNGRCNITNLIEDPRKLVQAYGANGKFLFSALSKFGPREVIEFFNQRGVRTKVEDNNRVFTASDKAADVLRALVNYLKYTRVQVRTGARVKEITSLDNKIEKIILANGEEIVANKFIITTGGKSYPLSGSTGDGYKWLKDFGHEIVPTLPALTSLVLKDKFIPELEGVSLARVQISLLRDKKNLFSGIGETVFTRDGISGPLILNMSNLIGRELPAKLKLQIDFYPDLDLSGLDKKIQKDFQVDKNKSFKNFIAKLLAPKLAPIIIKLSGIDPEKKVNQVSGEERRMLIRLLKEFGLEIYGLAGYERAMLTSGGVKLSEVDPKTMKSKLIDNLYLAGEMLDLAGPTGGFNLQVSWSTGYIAGESAAGLDLGFSPVKW
jgi:predicted Rossmann fold flavoprotein